MAWVCAAHNTTAARKRVLQHNLQQQLCALGRQGAPADGTSSALQHGRTNFSRDCCSSLQLHWHTPLQAGLYNMSRYLCEAFFSWRLLHCLPHHCLPHHLCLSTTEEAVRPDNIMSISWPCDQAKTDNPYRYSILIGQSLCLRAAAE